MVSGKKCNFAADKDEKPEMMKQIATTFLLLLCAIVLQAQSIAVESFRMDQHDTTANTTGTIVLDQNGEKCALIKVETMQTGFSFDAGSLGIVKTEQKVGEIWVYVPQGVKRLTISHQQLGVLRDYDLGQNLQRARTYILKLTTGEVQTIVRQARTSQYVVFQLTPANAVVELDGELLQTTDGTAMKMMRFGTYDYRVQAPDYKTEAGKVTVSDPKQKHVVTVTLKPNFSQVTLQTDNNAEIWVNGQRRGAGTWTGTLGAGTYELETRLAGHRPQTITRDIVATATPQTIRLQAPTPIYGEADISSTPAMADLYIDGKPAGQTPQLLSQLLVGQHSVRLSRKGYADYSGTITVSEGETAQLQATLKKTADAQPQPAIGSADDGQQRRTFTVDGVSFTMIRVDGGTFQMGATAEQGSDAYDDEKPAHQVTLSSYYMGETEVTQQLWQAVMGSNPSSFKGAQRPVEKVSWNDCLEFVRKLNAKTGMRFRLPTEAEWEYAARGGSKSQGYKYSGSNTLGSVAWYTDNSGSTTHDVKTKQANELGIYDMSGNVWEWCNDWYGSYSSNAQTNPTGPTSGSSRVIRGGGWSNRARNCRSSRRGNSTPDHSYGNLGLRLAL